jgi:hypothetical protein
MKTQTETITPEYASTLLASNINNRRLRDAKIKQYARDMANGAWVLTHQGIAIYQDGTIADGQHRLEACVRADASFVSQITYDLPRKAGPPGRGALEVRDAIDVGAPRGLGDQLHLGHNIPNANFVASVVNKLTFFVIPSMPILSVRIAAELYRMFEREITDFRSLAHQQARQFETGYIAAPICLYAKYDFDKAMEFTRQLCTMREMTNGPRLFRQWFDSFIGRGASRRFRVEPHPAMRLLAIALMDFDTGVGSRRRLRLSEEGHTWLLSLKPNITRKIRELLTVPDVAPADQDAA